MQSSSPDDTIVRSAAAHLLGHAVAGARRGGAGVAAASVACSAPGCNAARFITVAAATESQASHLADHGRRSVASGDVRPQAKARRDGWPRPCPRASRSGQQLAQLQGQKLVCLGPQFPFEKSGPEPDAGQHVVSAHRLGDRRHLPRALDDDRRDQSRSGSHVHEHRLADRRPAEHGSLGHLRSGQRGGGFAGVRRAGIDRARDDLRSRSPRDNGAADSCPAAIRACNCAARAIRCST